jgi:hypothetical protein
MDRRRFVPAAEGLEGRTLMSTISTTPAATVAAAAAAASVQGLPNTAKQKMLRIERLPFFLRSYQPDRFLPESVITPLQNNLLVIQGHLHPVPSPLLEQFNLVVRNAIPHQTLSVQVAQSLNQAFGRVLEAACAPPDVVAGLKANMNDLAHIDSQEVNPILLATNDYSIVLQTALGVGLPIRTPAAPTLAPADQIGSTGSRVTANPQPHLVGSYEPGSTMEILDTTGAVVGSGIVGANGLYSAQFSSSLSVGRYQVRIRAIDTGDVSAPSALFVFRVVAPRPTQVVINAAHPQGPLASK